MNLKNMTVIQLQTELKRLAEVHAEICDGRRYLDKREADNNQLLEFVRKELRKRIASIEKSEGAK